MNYIIKAHLFSNIESNSPTKQSHLEFGTTAVSSNILSNPAEVFLSSFAGCIFKNVERFSKMMKFKYSKAELEVNATRCDNPPRIHRIIYNLTIYNTSEKLNLALLKKNIEKYGTIYNTIKLSCTIFGTISTANTANTANTFSKVNAIMHT